MTTRGEGEKHPLVSIVIPAHNARVVLERCLPSVVDEGFWHGGVKDIIIVDDGSTDGTAEWLRTHYGWVMPVLQVLRQERRIGFARSVLHGVQVARAPLVLLLNADVVVCDGALGALVRRMEEDTALFAVGPLVHYARGEVLGDVYQGHAQGRWRFGHLSLHTTPGVLTRCRPTLFVSGGMGLFRREPFLQLGGFDPLYAPLYCEDVDLCWRAWRAGWRCLVEPAAQMQHEHQGTVGQMYTPRALQRAGARTTLLLTWLCVRDRRWLALHLLTLPLWFLVALLTRHVFAGALWDALRVLPRVLVRRRQRAPVDALAVRSDRDIWAMVADGPGPDDAFVSIRLDKRGERPRPHYDRPLPPPGPERLVPHG